MATNQDLKIEEVVTVDEAVLVTVEEAETEEVNYLFFVILHETNL